MDSLRLSGALIIHDKFILFLPECLLCISATVAWWITHWPRDTKDLGLIPDTGRYIVDSLYDNLKWHSSVIGSYCGLL